MILLDALRRQLAFLEGAHGFHGGFGGGHVGGVGDFLGDGGGADQDLEEASGSSARGCEETTFPSANPLRAAFDKMILHRGPFARCQNTCAENRLPFFPGQVRKKRAFDTCDSARLIDL